MSAIYLDTSAVLRAVLEEGFDARTEKAIAVAALRITSRLSLVESARALSRLRHDRGASETQLADAERQLDALWSRCHIYEITRAVCDMAARVAPRMALRTLDALHLATYVLARRHIEGLDLITTDRRLFEAARVT